MKLEVDETVQAELRDLGYARVRSNLSRTPWRVGIAGHFAHLRWFDWFAARRAVGVSVFVPHHAAHAFARTVRVVTEVSSDPGIFGTAQSARVILDGLERMAFPLLAGATYDGAMLAFLIRTVSAGQWPCNGAGVAAEGCCWASGLGLDIGRNCCP
jgi:hypothetical protein